MTQLRTVLEESKASGSLIGFCPWEDGDGEIWGRVIDISDTTFAVQEVDRFGKDDQVEEYEIGAVLYVDSNPFIPNG